MDNVIRMACDCGRELVFDSGDDRVDCDCGAVYVVTVSALRRPLEAES